MSSDGFAMEWVGIVTSSEMKGRRKEGDERKEKCWCTWKFRSGSVVLANQVISRLKSSSDNLFDPLILLIEWKVNRVKRNREREGRDEKKKN